MADPVAQLTAILDETHQPKMPLRPHQVREYEEEARRLGGIIEQKDVDGTPGRSWIGGDPSKAARRVRQIKDILDQQAPKKLEGERQNRAYALLTEIKNDIIKPAMLSKAEHRRAPSGAVGEFMRREMNRDYKHAVLEWKRGVFAVDPQPVAPDPDHASIERFRPEGTHADGTSTFRAEATIPGYHAMTPAAKANWPLGEPTADTAQIQALRAELAELRAQLSADARAHLFGARTPTIAQSLRDERAAQFVETRPDAPLGRTSGVLATEPERQAKEQRRLAREANGHALAERKARQKAKNHERYLRRKAAKTGEAQPIPVEA